MGEYKMSREIAHQIAIGLYKHAGEFIAVAKRDNHNDYECFKRKYLSKQPEQSPSPTKRRCTRNRQNISR